MNSRAGLSVFITALIAICIGWVVSGGVGAKKQICPINPVGLPDEGITIVKPGDSSFDELASTHSRPESTRHRQNPADGQFSVVVVNNSGEALVAVALKWELLQPDGRTIVHSQSHSNGLRFPMTHANGELSEAISPSLAPSGARVFTLTGPSRNARRGWRTSGSDERERQLSESTAVTVSIDGALFADGTFVGPDTRGFFSSWQSDLNARRDLLAETTRLMRGGRERAFTQIESLASREPGGADAAGRADEYYSLVRTRYARELIAKRKALGDEAFLRSVEDELNKPAVELRKR